MLPRQGGLLLDRAVTGGPGLDAFLAFFELGRPPGIFNIFPHGFNKGPYILIFLN